MTLSDVLFGRPLATDEEGEQKIGWIAGVPMLGLDALSSAAYGPEAAMTLLIVLGAPGIGLVVPISITIIVLLSIVFVSYQQTIAAYPSGGGSYTVARENLGLFPGLQHPHRQIAVLIPELVARHWYHHFLHNKRAAMLKALLLVRGDEDVVVINVPWYLSQ